MITPGLLKSLLDENGIGYKQNGKSFICTCPKCHKREKLYIRKKDGRFVCWYCKEIDGFQGAPEFVFRELLELPISRVRNLLYGEQLSDTSLYLDLQLEDWFDSNNDEIPLDVNVAQEVLPDLSFRDLDSEFGKKGLDYLLSRDIPLEIAKQYEIQYWPSESRVVFPVKSKGKWLGWQSRYVKDHIWYDNDIGVPMEVPKVLSCSGMKRDRVLMFSDRINSDYVVLAEGPVSAIKAHLCGCNVATMGKAVSKFQLELLKNAGIKRVYLALDPDAFQESQRLLKEVQDIDFYDMRPPKPYKDIGDMSFDQAYNLFKNSPKIDRNFLFVYFKNHFQNGI